MRRWSTYRTAALGIVLAHLMIGPATIVPGMIAPVRADDDFFKGKTVNFIVSTTPGGGYDTYSRLIARHIGRFLPGGPNVVVQYMPGAGGMRAANFLFNSAPRDGTTLAMLDQAVQLDHVLGTAGLSADPARFNWIGRLLSNSAVLYARHDAPVKKIEDAFAGELVVATSGTSSRLNWIVLNNVVGTRMKLITGYAGTTNSRLAMMRGEVDALSQPWAVLKVEGEQLLRERQINLLLQSGAQKNAELMHVPRMIDLTKNDDDRTLLMLFSSPSTIGRSVVAPPGLPAERVATLRRAFTAALADAAFRDEAQKLKLDIEPLDGTELQANIAMVARAAPELVARARRVAER
jgi:tripartite-type tricarboxylate transporter receptor subunit TctC